jgi:hypothetical protein
LIDSQVFEICPSDGSSPKRLPLTFGPRNTDNGLRTTDYGLPR